MTQSCSIERKTMHRLSVFLLLALWAGLSAGMTLPADFMHAEMQSVIEDLQVALNDYNSILKETPSLKDLEVLPCTETAAHLDQGSRDNSVLALRLSEYQSCAERLRPVCDSDALCRVFTLNQDLLQHLGSYQSSAACASSSSSSSSSSSFNFNSLRKSIQCLQCWSQQVAALSK